MEKKLHTSLLLDFYGELLSKNQKIAVEMCYNKDLSLSEIGQQMDMTRQGARDLIKRGEASLYNYEEKLGLCSKFRAISKELDSIKESALEIINLENKEEILEKAEKIISIADNMKY